MRRRQLFFVFGHFHSFSIVSRVVDLYMYYQHLRPIDPTHFLENCKFLYILNFEQMSDPRIDIIRKNLWMYLESFRIEF